jgi:triosephosphate isomerase
MKPKLFLANWKMSLKPSQAAALAKELVTQVKLRADQEVCLFPSFSALDQVSKIVSKSPLKIGAQDVFWQEHGAYTGEESVLTLKEFSCVSVLKGHSERRKYCGETDEMVNKKVLACLDQGLRPVICVGETFEQRKNGQKDFIVMQQLERALHNVSLAKYDRLVIAYEPVWEIGSGQAAAPDEVWYTLQVLKHFLLNNYSGEAITKQISFIYGGSVNPADVIGLFDHEVLEGVLVGGASLSADDFNQLLKEVS